MKTKQVTVDDLIAALAERDTYRDLCAELLESQAHLVKIVESAGVINLMDGVQIGKVSWGIKCNDAINYSKNSITKAESILGDSNAT